MDTVEFYDVRKREKVAVPMSAVKRTKYATERGGKVQYRYALKAEHDGSKLTKFVSKEVWDSTDVPEL